MPFQVGAGEVERNQQGADRLLHQEGRTSI